MIEEYGFDLHDLDEKMDKNAKTRKYALSDLRSLRKQQRKHKNGSDLTGTLQAKKDAGSSSPLKLTKNLPTSSTTSLFGAGKSGRSDITAGKIGTLLESHKHLKQFTGGAIRVGVNLN